MSGRNQRAANFRQFIVDARRNGGKHRARDQSIALQPAQRQRQHALGDGAHRPADFVEAHGAVGQEPDDVNRPLVPDAGQHIRHRPAVAAIMW